MIELVLCRGKNISLREQAAQHPDNPLECFLELG
jgi:hypothetical protein